MEHLLLGNWFLISKYTQPLLSNNLANKQIPTEMIGATIEELCFLLVSAGGDYKENSRSKNLEL
jgi:hypothetical protein